MGMIADIAFYPVMGVPLVAIGGMITFLFLLTTATIGLTIFSGKSYFTINQHKMVALTTVALASIHGLVALLGFLGF
ncbi:MAG: hypothetical protein AABW59_05740 [archaeon]